MAGPSDHELIAEIQAGRRDALGLLFDRYASPLYEFIYYITGDRDESARLLEHVFTRVPSAIAGMGDNETIRGWLYGLAGEASLSYLRLKDRLDALPPSDETAAPGLSGDIWQAARGIPGFMRAALVVEELHGLAPTEKARVLNVPRLEVPRLVEQARAAFTAQFDNEAGLQGRPLASQVDTDRTWGIRRRLPAPGSLFGYLPLIPLPETLARAIRAQITGGTRPVRPVPVPMPAPAPTRPPVPARPPISAPVRVQERPVREELQPLPPLEPVPTRVFPEGCSLPVILGALLIALIITGIAAIIGFSMVRDSTGPTIARVEPADKSSIPIPTGATTARVILTATFRDDRAVNFRTVRLILDGQDVTGQTVVSNTGLSYPTDLPAGAHIAYLELFDNSGNKSSMLWQFTVLPPVEPTATPTMTPLPTAIATTTRAPSATPTGTPQPPVITTFTASQSSTRPGVPVQLTWAVTNAESVFLNQEKVTLTGTRAVTPSVTTTYHLIATNAGGTIDRTVTITVTAAPDLTVTDISIGAGATVVYTIKNIGVGDITQMFLIQVLADGAPIDSNRRITSLAAGQEASLTVPNYTLLGTHMITVRVNGTQEIPEASFTNNELTRSLVGPTPTPTITLTPTRTNTPPPPTTAPTHTPTSTPTFTPTFTPTPTRTRTSTSAP